MEFKQKLRRISNQILFQFNNNSRQWENLNNNLMNHMTPTGTKGLDLYTWVDGAWRFVNSGAPPEK